MSAIELYSTPLFNDANLLSYYRMEGDSDDAKDSVNGVDTNVSYDADYGVFNKGAYLASNAYIDLGNNFDFHSTSTFSFSFWLKYTFSDDGLIISKQKANFDESGHTRGYNIEADDSQLLFTLMETNEAPADVLDFYVAAINDGKWHLLTWTYDGSKTVAGNHIYVDGSEVSKTTNRDNLSGDFAIGSAANFQINGRGGASYTWVGDVDDFAVFDRVLTEDEISKLYSGEWVGSPTTNYLKYYRRMRFPGAIDGL